MSSGQLQMIYVAALLCAAADVPERSAPEDCLASIRASAPHAPSDLRACEAKLRSWSRRVLHPRLNAHAAKGPAERSVLDRMPSLSGLLPMPLLHVLVATQVRPQRPLARVDCDPCTLSLPCATAYRICWAPDCPAACGLVAAAPSSSSGGAVRGHACEYEEAVLCVTRSATQPLFCAGAGSRCTAV